MKGRPRPARAGKPRISIEILDTQNNETTVYPSISEAARAIGMNQSSITGAFLRKPGESTIFVKKMRYKLSILGKSS